MCALTGAGTPRCYCHSCDLTAICVLNMRDLLVLGIAAVADYATIYLAYAAVGGWLSCVSHKEDENKLSAYVTAAILVVAG
jgi:hypothetical protein